MNKLSFDISPQGPYFSVLRSAIWQTPVDTHAWPQTVDWQPILDNYKAQCLLPLVGPVLMTLPEPYCLSQDQQDNILSTTAQYVRSHYRMRQAIVEAFTALEGVGCHPILLKGEGLASLYPQPNNRSVGDIDVYVGKEHYEEAKQIAQSFSTEQQIAQAQEDDHQYHIDLKNGTTLEVHPIAGYSAIESKQEQYVRWTQTFLTASRCDHVTINSKDILVPPMQQNLPYLFDHLCRHFRFEGLGLRQLVDLALVLGKTSNGLDTELFKADLQRLDLLRAWQVLGGIMIDYLGFPREQYPFYDARKAKKSQGEILRNIILDGNFGHDTTWRVHAEYRKQLPILKQIQLEFHEQSQNGILFPGYGIHKVFLRYLTYPYRRIKRAL